MKLYSVDLSPYAARVRIAIHAKNLPIEITSPPGGMGSAEYKKINPTGKVPALEVDGTVIPESEVINEYLEDRFPTPSLRPAEPLARARMRLLSRFSDLYLTPDLAVLFGQMNPSTRDAELVQKKLAELSTRLDQLEQLVDAAPYAVGSNLSLADCALVPALFVLGRGMLAVGGSDPLATRPRLKKINDTASAHPAVAKVLGEMGAAMAQMQRGRS